VATAYGLVTSTIAHEMGHILDPEGRKYDADGLQVRGWKNPADSANYDLKSKLIQNQFAAVVIPELPGVKLNAANTNIEDVADFSGMQICIKALESRLAKIRSVNPRDPNLLPDKKDRTPWQRFFIGCSAQMASNHSKAELKEWINAEFHTPEKWRTNVVLPNFAQFQRAFNIPADSPMYREPHRRVNVW
jgi:putative endopeptidase